MMGLCSIAKTFPVKEVEKWCEGNLTFNKCATDPFSMVYVVLWQQVHALNDSPDSDDLF